MPSTQDYLVYVQENLRLVDGFSVKRMMGEYLLYRQGVLFGGIYDNRFLVKKVPSLLDKGFKEIIPYPGAKAMFLVDSEDPRELADLVEMVCRDLSSKPKR